MKKTVLCVLLMIGIILSAVSLAQGITLDAYPDVLRPGESYSFEFTMPFEGYVSLAMQSAEGKNAYTIVAGYPAAEGSNILGWDGMTAEENPVESGEYVLVLTAEDGQSVSMPMRVGAPMPMLTHVLQNETVLGEEPLEVAFQASQDGTMTVAVVGDGMDQTMLAAIPVTAGGGIFTWDGTLNGETVPAGEYMLDLQLLAENGQSSMHHNLWIEVTGDSETDDLSAGFITLIQDTPGSLEGVIESNKTPPYSTDEDGISFWSLSPGETDEALIWQVLTQPITVYKNADATGHTYLMENPDGTGKQVAQIHGKSQGLHIIGEVNEYGWVLAEAFSNYDPEYRPDVEDDGAYTLRRGYVKAAGLKTVEVSQKYGIVVDILSQRLYLYIDGKCVTELFISTGKVESGKPYNETIAGEFITISRTGGFYSGNMYCDMALRINGGILLHEVPCKINADGTHNYSSFEGYLGTVQSHGCIRIQRLKNADGYNHTWLWKNIPLNTKVLVWSRVGRTDEPNVWYQSQTGD